MMVDFHVLKCSECQTFQVLQVTKSLKWKCKMCGNKQSIIQIYGHGTGADCRKHVQKLNTFRGELDQIKEEASFLAPVTPASLLNNSNASEKKQTSNSHWAKFISEAADHVSDDEDENTNFVDNVCVTTDRAFYEAERKQSKINRRRMNYKEHHCSDSQRLAKRFKELDGRMDKKLFVASNSASLGQNFLPVMQSSSLQSIQISEQDYPQHSLNRLKERIIPQTVSKNSERDSCDRLRNIFGGNINQEKEETPKVMKKTSPTAFKFKSFSTQENNSLKNNLKTASKSSDIKNKKSNVTAQSSNPSKWASFLDDDQDENIESDEDNIDLSLNDCGQLTVSLPDSVSGSSKYLFYS